MAVWVICRALEMLELLPEEQYEQLCEKIRLRPEEIDLWEDVSRKMRVVFHDDGIISQFEGFDRLEEFDWDGYREKYGDIQRLDRILEAEGDSPNRYKLSKQADVLMLFFLFSSEELGEIFKRLGYPFEYETIPKNIEYYLNRTSHGSTLSRVVHSWVLARSDRVRSWELFCEALKSDIEDIQGGTTPEGIHLGAMAGTVELITRCYTGIEVRERMLRFNPCLPQELGKLHMHARCLGHSLEIDVSSDKLRITSLKSVVDPIRIGCDGEVFELAPGETKEIELRDKSRSCD
jgi:alpha,alpha-trehalase